MIYGVLICLAVGLGGYWLFWELFPGWSGRRPNPSIPEPEPEPEPRSLPEERLCESCGTCPVGKKTGELCDACYRHRAHLRHMERMERELEEKRQLVAELNEKMLGQYAALRAAGYSGNPTPIPGEQGLFIRIRLSVDTELAGLYLHGDLLAGTGVYVSTRRFFYKGDIIPLLHSVVRELGESIAHARLFQGCKSTEEGTNG